MGQTMAGDVPDHKPDHHGPGASFPGSLDNARQDDWDTEQENIVPLTKTEAVRLFGPDVSRPSRVTPFRVVGAQVVLTLCATLVWWLCSNEPSIGALSAFLGGTICWGPGALIALQLQRGGFRSAAGWLAGEVLRIGMTIAMIIAVAVLFAHVHWLPFLVTFLLVLKTYWLALLLR
jgi:ATP synthase protein I